MTVQIRSFSDIDVLDIIKLLNTTYQNAYEFSPYTEEGLRSWIQEGKLKILVVEEDGRFVGSAAYHDGHWGEEVEWLAVPERPDRKAIEKSFVDKIEKYVKGNTVFTAVDSGSPKIAEWAERGYKAEGGLCHLTAKLNELRPVPEVPEGIVLRNLKADEEEQMVEAVNSGFGFERLKLGNLQTWKTDDPPFDERWVQVAETEGKIVSVVVAKPDTNYNKTFNCRRGYLGPATTLADFRGKNLASALTVRAMNLLFTEGMDSVGLFTSEKNAASLTLLEKVGFETSHVWKFMRKNLP